MRKLWIAAAPLLLLLGAPAERPRTFANPINIDYRFMVDLPSRREAADPAIVLFGDDYYLFASKSGGYWHSKDMVEWTFVTPTGLPMEAYAPAVMVLDHTLYYTACNIGLYKSGDPKGDKWELVSQTFSVGDPDLFADDDGRVYLYYGLSYNGAISGMELDPNNQFRPIGEPFLCFRANYARHGWERRGDDNLGAASNNQFQEGPWLEGSWMTKHGGTYYLQYASPGTEFRTYADGVYTATSPRGPFTYSQSSPFSHKPTGFITGAGHSATFADKQGHYWHIATMVISVKHQFERRLGLFPAGFDADGVLHVNTLFGDYPQVVPKERKDGGVDAHAGWMLLSYGKSAQASSSLDGFGPEKAFDEDIKTYWSARTASPGEWFSVDLGKRYRVEAVQVSRTAEGTIVTFQALGGLLFGKIGDQSRADPPLPRPPRVPQGRVVRRRDALDIIAPARAVLPALRVPDPHNPYAFYWREGRCESPSDRYSLECDLFRHGGHEELIELPFFLPRKAKMRDGIIEVEVFARNLSRAVTMKMPVSVSSALRDTSEVARKILDEQLPAKPQAGLSFEA